MTNDKQNPDEEESKRILERVERDSETIGTSSFVRAARKTRNHFMAGDPAKEDPIEVWGTRIGRFLALIGFVVLVIYLYYTYLK